MNFFLVCGRRLGALTSAILATVVLWTGSEVRADIGQTYGFGSQAASLGGATVARQDDAFASYFNPALMTVAKERLSLSWGLIAMEPRFTAIPGVTLTNSYSSEKDTVGDVNLDYRTTFGQLLGLIYRFDSPRRLSFGVTTFVPLNQVAYMDTGDVFAPEYVLYRTRTQRPQFSFASAAELGAGFSLGLGIHLAFNMTANADVFLQTASGKPSSMRFATSLKPRANPYFGLLFAPGGAGDWSLGLSARLASSNEASMDLTSGIKLGILPTTLDFIFHTNGVLYYDPLTVQVGGQLPWGSGQRTYAEIDFEAWQHFKAPALTMTRDPLSADLRESINPQFETRNLWVPRIGHEAQWGETTLRLGYAYRGSIFKTLPTGAGNYLDPAKHMLQAGLGWEFPSIGKLNAPFKIDLHAAYHLLKSEHVEKTAGDEAGNPAGTKIGAPGYDTGGKIYGGGVSVTLKI